MYTKMLLTAALLIPSSSAPVLHTPTIVPANAPVDHKCLVELFIEQPECTFFVLDCDTGMEHVIVGNCEWAVTGCPCDDPVATVAMPQIGGKPATVLASARREFRGLPSAPGAFVSSRPRAYDIPEGFELLLDEAVQVNGRPYRVVSFERSRDKKRIDLGFEMTGVDPGTTEQFARGTVRAKFGSDMQAWINTPSGPRVFHLISTGKPSVVESPTPDMLLPEPDNTVPALVQK